MQNRRNLKNGNNDGMRAFRSKQQWSGPGTHGHVLLSIPGSMPEDPNCMIFSTLGWCSTWPLTANAIESPKASREVPK